MRWRKVGVVASTEFDSSVRTKAFLISLLALPLIMGGSAFLQIFLAKRADVSPRPFAVVDRTGALYGEIAGAAEMHNQAVTKPDGSKAAPTFVPQAAEPGDRTDSQLVTELSERTRQGDLFAFAVIPADILEVKPFETPEDDRPKIRYYSNNPNDNALQTWLEATVNSLVRARRLQEAGIRPEQVASLSQSIGSEGMMLVDRKAAAATPSDAAAGAAGAETVEPDAKRVDRVRSALVPAVLMFVVFLIVMSTTPALLQSVIEEKMSRISEVLLGSITPYELMMGKLLGGVGVALVLATLYVGGGYAVAAYYGYADAVSPALLATTALFIVLAVVLYGSLYLAIGSACSELKDAQSLMMPVMLLSMFPVFVWAAVLQQPNGPLAVGMSLFPPATPYLMLLRMALQPPPPAWQVGLSIVLTLAAVLACVWAAGKIFRVGLLMQGKAPSFGQLMKWVVAR